MSINCKDCGYHWQEEYEDYPCCHFVPRAPGEVAPCDEPDPYEPEDRYTIEDLGANWW